MTYTSEARTIKEARKPHRCDWCEEEIPVGASYRTWTGVWDGCWITTKAHPECCEAMHAMPSEFLQDGWTTGSFERGTDHEKGCGCEPSCRAEFDREQKVRRAKRTGGGES